MKHFRIKVLAVVVLLVPVFYFLAQQNKIYSTSATNLKDSLSSAQLSYFARLGTGNTATNSNIDIATSGNPSNTTSNLFIGDTIAIGNTSVEGSTLYTVTDIADTNTISINTGLGSSNAFTDAYIIATRSAIHTISFYPQDSISSSKWQILLKATTTSGETYNDGMPDQGGFDIGHLTAGAVACPWGATATIGTTAVVSSNSYHVITCTLDTGDTNPINVGSTITIGVGLSQMINPSATTSHTLGASDVYTFYLRNLDSSDNSISSTQGKLAINDSVNIIATIDPTITFYIDNVGTSQSVSRCGTTLSSGASNTTATSVNFGSITLGQANTLAQRFSCSTNATNGYTVQTFENKPLTITNIGSSATIADTDCDVGSTCTTTVSGSWDEDLSTSQFGYSLEAISASPVTFSSGTDFTAKPFGIGYTNAQTIMSRTSTPSSADQAYICYRITAANSQEAGTYQNQINFIATATF